MSSPRIAITVYGRDGCHLCEEAVSGIRELRPQGVTVEVLEVDIESDDELLAAFLERIPVVELNGAIIGELEIDADQIREAIVAAVSIGSHEHDD